MTTRLRNVGAWRTPAMDSVVSDDHNPSASPTQVYVPGGFCLAASRFARFNAADSKPTFFFQLAVSAMRAASSAALASKYLTATTATPTATTTTSTTCVAVRRGSGDGGASAQPSTGACTTRVARAWATHACASGVEPSSVYSTMHPASQAAGPRTDMVTRTWSG